MGNKPKTQPQNDRRAKVEALKRQQKATERRKTMTVVAAAVVVAGALIAIPTVQILKTHKEKTVPLAEIGVGASAANCGETIVDKTTGTQQHIPGHLDYAQIPPSSGNHHNPALAVNPNGFYSTKDRPAVEDVVHNLEHGYTVLWYEPTLDRSGVADIKKIAARMRADDNYRYFLAVPWDTSRGGFPNGKPYALTHWGAKEGFRQYCGIVSGEAVESFAKAHTKIDSPEPKGY